MRSPEPFVCWVARFSENGEGATVLVLVMLRHIQKHVTLRFCGGLRRLPASLLAFIDTALWEQVHVLILPCEGSEEGGSGLHVLLRHTDLPETRRRKPGLGGPLHLTRAACPEGKRN